MDPTQSMKFNIGINHFIGYPSSVLARPFGFGAGADDSAEIPVQVQVENPTP